MYTSRRGRIPWNKDKKGVMPIPWNIGITGKDSHSYGNKHSVGRKPWNKNNHTQCNTGKTHFKKGHIPWNKGKTKDKFPQLAGLCGRKKGFISSRKGVTREQEYGKKKALKMRRKRSEALKHKWASKEYREMMLKAHHKRWLSKEPTSIEKKLYEELKSRGILFEKQRLINGHFIVDAYIPSLNLVIEADGDYFHSREDVKKHDKAKNAYLTKCGFGLLRLWGTEIRDDSFKEKLDKYIKPLAPGVGGGGVKSPFGGQSSLTRIPPSARGANKGGGRGI